MTAALAAFGVVFVAELGDRTQLLIVSLASRHRPGPVVSGVTLGYLVTTIASVAVGSALGAALPDRAVQVASGLLFLGFAVWALLGDDDDDDDVGADDGRGGVGLALSLAGAIVVSELGDKSMLATATLAAERGSPVLVAVGALLGILAAGLLGVVVGRVLGDRLPDRALRLASAALFAAIGVGLLVAAL